MTAARVTASRRVVTVGAYSLDMSDFWDLDGSSDGGSGSGDSDGGSGRHCDACNEWMEPSDTHCPSCGCSR